VLNALTSSINNAFISMAQKLDQCSIRSAAEALGVHRADGKPLGTNPSAVLGTNEIAPLTMAAAFAGIANKGVYCTPIAIDSMTDASGAPVTVPQSTCNQSVAPNIAATMAYAMKAVVTGGTATLSSPGDGIQLIGKTGTTDSEIHTWMVGSSTKVATAVWVGNVEGFVSIRNSRINGVAGGDIRHHIFRNYMRLANEKYGGDSFPSPDDKLLSAPSVGIPNLVGSTMSNAESTLTNLGFTFVDGGPMDSDRPAGQVAGTDPPAGASITMGSTVTVYSSNGSLAALPNVVGQKITDATLALTGWNVKQVLKLDLTCVPDTVLSQDPAAGLAKKAEITVTLVVCKKP
jgi:membrane peptidoglycan carboxypeptidase